MEVSNMSKSTFQKTYEKMTMIEQNHNNLVLLGVEYDDGRPAVVLAIRNGDTVTPVAEMLSQEQCDAMNPNLDYSQRLIAIVDGAREIEDRVGREAFDGQHPKMDQYFKTADF